MTLGRGWRSHRLVQAVRARVHRSPTLSFGLPFVLSIVVGSMLLAQVTRQRYIVHDAKVRALSQEEKLRLRSDRKRLDIREEYFVRGAANPETPVARG